MGTQASLLQNSPGRSWTGGAAPSAQTPSSGNALPGVTEFARRNRALEDQLAHFRREHDKLRRSLFEAAQVQRKLCGCRYLRRGPFEFAGEIFPVDHLSGDLVTVFDRGADLLFAIGDIAGKGLPAALWFTHVVAMLQLEAGCRETPAAALTALNRDLAQMRFTAPFASLFLARLDLHTGELLYSNAGHPPALLFGRDGRVESLGEGGPLLGALPEAGFVEGAARLQPGDTLLGYSDGIIECGNASDEQFGLTRLITTVRSSPASSSTATLFSVLGAVKDFAGSQPRQDDLAVLVVRHTSDRPGAFTPEGR